VMNRPRQKPRCEPVIIIDQPRPRRNTRPRREKIVMP
jgi:hypothetical protein